MLPVLLWLLAGVCASNRSATPLPYRSLGYPNAWLATEGLIVCAHVLVVLELGKVLLRDLPGITTLARRYIK